MKSPNRRLLFFLLSVAVLVSMCVAATAAGYVAYRALGGQAAELLRDPIKLLENEPTAPEDIPQTPLGADVDLAKLFIPFWESREIIHADFVEQPVDDALLAQGALDGLLATLSEFEVDLEAVELPANAPAPAELAKEARTPEEVSSQFEEFWAAWGKAEYADLAGSLTYEALMREALRSMVAALGDEHTGYLDPFQLRQSDLSLEGEYEGIGAWVDPTTDYLTIIAPMEGSPAQAAGLQPGDRVLAVDGQDMTGVDGNVVISHILGPAGSLVVLTIDRESATTPFDVEIVRAAIFVASVQSEMLEDKIAYVQLLTFGAGSNLELRQALEELLAQNPIGLILDLRNNGGGFLDTAVETSSEFIADGVILYEEFGDGSRQTYEALSGGLATEIPLVVLVNGGSASASEILAGAVQDHGRGILLGETTFGKGSVQVSPELSNGQGALRITVAHWLTPSERQIHGQGLVPDLVVAFSEADVEAGRDPQLEGAIEYLLD